MKMEQKKKKTIFSSSWTRISP